MKQTSNHRRTGQAAQRPTPKVFASRHPTSNAEGAASAPQIWVVSRARDLRDWHHEIHENIGMLLLAVYLIVDGLLGFGLNIGPAIFLLYIIALAAGIFILIGK